MPLINGPSFTASLPFSWDTGEFLPQHGDWEILRYLMVLADFEQSNPALELAQAKQDLLLLWLAKSQTINLPQTQPICVGMKQIEWQSSQPIKMGEVGTIKLAFSTQFPMLLTFKAKIEQAVAQGESWQVSAQIIELSPQVLDHFEQTVFRYHRRAIQQSKQAAV